MTLESMPSNRNLIDSWRYKDDFTPNKRILESIHINHSPNHRFYEEKGSLDTQSS